MTERLRIVAIALLALGLAVGLVWIERVWLALGAAGLGLLWLAGGSRSGEERPYLDMLGLVGYCGLAADGLMQGLPGWLALLAVLLALAGWDLSRFKRRLAEAAPLSAPPLTPDEGGEGGEAPTPVEAVVSAVQTPNSPAARMERTHLARLGLALGGGLLLGGLALLVRIPLEFGAALAIGLVAVIALSRVVREVNQ